MHPNVHCSTVYNTQDMEAIEITKEALHWVLVAVHRIFVGAQGLQSMAIWICGFFADLSHLTMDKADE